MTTRNIMVRLHPGSKKEEVRESDTIWEVYVRAPAVEGKANAALLSLIAEHLDCPKSAVKLLRGKTSRLKALTIPTKQ